MKRILASWIFAAALLAQPTVTAVVDGAAYTADLAQGSVLVVKGSGLSPLGVVSATAPYPSALNGVRMTLTAAGGGAVVVPGMVYTYGVDGVSQLAAVLPSTAAIGAYDLRVENGSATSAPFRTMVVARKPGIVTISGDGLGAAQATLEGKLILQRTANLGRLGNFDTRPARLGDRVDVWGTGLGADPAGDAGGTPVNQTVTGQVRVLVNGAEVVPDYAGRSAGLPGLDQIVFMLPQTAPLHCQVDVQVRVGTVLSNSVTIATSGADACPATTTFRINEVESSGGSPGDWVELFNPGPAPVNLAGYTFKDSDDTHHFTLPSASIVPAGGFLVLEEADFGFGLGAQDSVRLFRPDGTLADSYTWTAHAGVSFGRCVNGSGPLQETAVPTKGAANDCSQRARYAPWPGNATIQTADEFPLFHGNLSGLVYEPADPEYPFTDFSPDVMWAVRNAPAALFALTFDGLRWSSGPSDNWTAGRPLRYSDGTGDPDAEGITYGDATFDGLYVATERNNAANTISRNSVLRYDVFVAADPLRATQEWNLTADLPATGPNVGMEAIAWVPDTFLVAKGFFDESKNRTYRPADYPEHAGGVFLVGLEANGKLYAYVLNHSKAGGFTRVATIESGLPGVMELQFDRDLKDLWALCDDSCQGRATVLRIGSNGRFSVAHQFERPTGMPNLNNEGFAIAPAGLCVGDHKPVFWADDSETDGHAIRTGTIRCSVF